MAEPRELLEAVTDMDHVLTAEHSSEWTPNDRDRVTFADPERMHPLGTVLTVRPGQWARVHWDDGLVSTVDIDDLRPADTIEEVTVASEPRTLLEKNANRTAFHHPDAGDVPVAHVASNMLAALCAVLDLCNKADHGVPFPFYGVIETVHIHDAITTALEGKA